MLRELGILTEAKYGDPTGMFYYDHIKKNTFSVTSVIFFGHLLQRDIAEIEFLINEKIKDLTRYVPRHHRPAYFPSRPIHNPARKDAQMKGNGV